MFSQLLGNIISIDAVSKIMRDIERPDHAVLVGVMIASAGSMRCIA